VQFREATLGGIDGCVFFLVIGSPCRQSVLRQSNFSPAGLIQEAGLPVRRSAATHIPPAGLRLGCCCCVTLFRPTPVVVFFLVILIAFPDFKAMRNAFSG
jgi:hypothetical protein